MTLAPVPASFRDPRDPLPATTYHLRPAVLDDCDDSCEEVMRRRSSVRVEGLPSVYFTLGTIFHQESGDLFRRALPGLSNLDAQIVVTVGHEIDPAELGPQAPNVRIERFISAGEILSRCELAVSHGGSGTVSGALAFGVPQVLLPMGADQPLNADRCLELGVAAVLDAATATAHTTGQTAHAVLSDGTYRTNASRPRDEIRALPRAAEAAERLERLAAAASP